MKKNNECPPLTDEELEKMIGDLDDDADNQNSGDDFEDELLVLQIYKDSKKD
ncbi:MAG TPA: hypothetical protein PKL13_03855 [bacterium]|nr:hypothetical protein [bacterium]